jgi:hypothetical protein
MRRLTKQRLLPFQTVYLVTMSDWDDYTVHGAYAELKHAEQVSGILNKQEEAKTEFPKPWWSVEPLAVLPYNELKEKP